MNDSLGHAAGDKLLELAARLVRAARIEDTVGRFGSDEFVILCEGVAGREAAEVIASRLADVVAPPVDVGHASGIRLAIDDFGTGYSSLAYLRSLSRDALKIHRSFIAGMTTSNDDHAIVQAIVALARPLRVDVVAEGVETPQQLARLLESGCSLAQGYAFGAPVPADEYERAHLRERLPNTASEAA